MSKYTICFTVFTDYTKRKLIFNQKNKCSLLKIHNLKRVQKPIKNTVKNVEKIKFSENRLTKNFTVFLKYDTVIPVIK